jgi:acyl carrier protein
MKLSQGKKNLSHGAKVIEAWMTLRLSQELGIEPGEIDPRLPFTSCGLDSMTAFNLTGNLADWLGRDLPATLFWDYPNIIALSEHLAQALDGQDLNFLHDELKRVVEEIKGLSEDAAQENLVVMNEQEKKED